MNVNQISRTYGKVYEESMSDQDILISCSRNILRTNCFDVVSGVISIKFNELMENCYSANSLSAKLIGPHKTLKNIEYSLIGCSKEEQRVYIYIEGNIGEDYVKSISEELKMYTVNFIEKSETEHIANLTAYGDYSAIKEFKTNSSIDSYHLMDDYINSNNVKVARTFHYRYLSEEERQNGIHFNEDFIKNSKIYGLNSIFYEEDSEMATLIDQENKLFICINVIEECTLFKMPDYDDEDLLDDYEEEIIRGDEANSYIRKLFLEKGQDNMFDDIEVESISWWGISYGTIQDGCLVGTFTQLYGVDDIVDGDISIEEALKEAQKEILSKLKRNIA